MRNRRYPIECCLRILGIVSPYLAVGLGLVYFKNGFLAVLLYHLLLVICSVGINRSRTGKLLVSGFHPTMSPLVCVGGLVPGVVLFFLWPIATLESVDLAGLLESVHLTKTTFMIFALYACLVNPFLEESFWRGCFKKGTLRPNYVDALFAGYHAVILIPIVKPVFVLAAFVALMTAGWLFRTLYRFTGGLAVPLLTHIIADIAIFLALRQILLPTA